MSVRSSKRSSVCTIRSKSTRRSTSNLALIQDQATPPTGSPILGRDSVDESRHSAGPQDRTDDTTPLNPGSNEDTNGDKATEREAEEGGEKGEEGKAQEGHWFQNARVILAHVGMVILCVFYALAGATIFYVIEQPQEHRIRNNNLRALRQTKNTILRELWEMSVDQSITQNEFRQAAYEKSDAFIKLLFESLDEGGYMSPAAVKHLLSTSTIFDDDPKKSLQQKHKLVGSQAEIPQRNPTLIPDMWSFMGALLFATATLTTVGYGHTAPVTTLGRLLCVGYGLLGIPLILMTITDIGKFLGGGLKRLYRLWRRCNKRMRDKIRASLTRSTKNERFYQLQTEEESTSATPKNEQEKEKDADAKSKENEREDNDKDAAEAKAAEELAADVATNLSVEWIFILIVGYTLMGAGMFTLIEPWSLLESFYFCFITMTTIGYGDFVPLNQTYFALTLLYIVLGLAITTMSIDQAGSEYIKKVHYFGRKIQSAKQVLSNVRNMISYANFMKRRYGLTDQQFRQMACLPMFGKHDRLVGAYMPACYRRLYWVDQRTESMLEEIFTITTLESDQDLDVEAGTENEFRTRHDAMMGGSNGQAVLCPQYRDHVSAWSKAKRRYYEQGRSAGGIASSFSCVNFSSPLHTPSSGHSCREMGHLERIAAMQWKRQADARRGKPFQRATSGTGLFDGSTQGSINNNYSPKLVSNAREHTATINRELTSVTLNEVDGSLISL